MSGNWSSNFASIQNTSGLQSSYINNITMDDLFNIKNDEKIDKIIKLKENILNIIQKKDDLNLIENDENYQNEEMDDLLLKIKENINVFNNKQNDLNKITDDFKKELDNIKEQINTIDNMIDFIKKLPNNYNLDETTSNIVKNMHELSKKIVSNEKISELKKNYIEKYKETKKYIHLIRNINQFNICNMCPLCFENQVDHFTNPCGHTYCKDCLKKQFNKDDDTIYQIGRNVHAHCPVCRDVIQKLHPLYFL